MLTKLFSFCFFVLFSIVVIAQNPYKIEFQINNFPDTVAYLSYYYGAGQFYRDTATVDSKGKMVFEGKDSLEHGMYSLILKNSKLFDFMVDKQEFTMVSDSLEYIDNMKVKGSPENDVFFEYLKYINVRKREMNELTKLKRIAAEKGNTNPQVDKRILQIDQEVEDFIENLHKKHPQSLTSSFLYAINYPTVPPAPFDEKGIIDSTFKFKYFKSHFFDNFDFSDERLLRTSAYHEKMTYYMDKLTVQDPDSIIISADYLLGKVENNPSVFKYTLSYMSSKYERSELMGMDAVFVHLGREYYMRKKAPWFTDEQLKKLVERVNALYPLLIGKKAPNIIVKDTAQEKFIQLYDIEAKFTIVYIWSPECGHCKVSTPKLKTLYDKVKDQGVEVFGIGNEFENEEWIDFINKYDLNWINGSDGGDFRSNFRALYDVYSTPQTYLLDKNKKILSKKMSVESLEKILEFYMNKEKEKNEE